ncbi:MAG: hypothetical protein ACOYOK_01075 [Pseudobdellovibrionaceae bacterium]
MLTLHFIKNLIFSTRSSSLVRRISMLSLINITLSVTAFLLVLFVMTGMNTSIRERIWALEPHLNIKVQAAPSTDFLRTHPVFQKLQQYEKSQVYEFESQDILIRSMDGQFRGAVARGMSPKVCSFFYPN